MKQKSLQINILLIFLGFISFNGCTSNIPDSPNSNKTQLNPLKNEITIDLISSTGIDYTPLKDLLVEKEWEKADKQTFLFMLRAAKSNLEEWPDSLPNISCSDLSIIDSLWRKYSNNHFGFSIQKNIWVKINGTIDYETEEKLGKIVGWNQDGFWLNYEQLIFELGNQTPKGHLPTGRSFILRRGKQAGMVEGVIPALLNESTMMAQKFVDCQI